MQNKAARELDSANGFSVGAKGLEPPTPTQGNQIYSSHNI